MKTPTNRKKIGVQAFVNYMVIFFNKSDCSIEWFSCLISGEK